MEKSNRQKLLYISIFGGLLGLDKFYQKQYILGFIKLFTFGLYGIWWVIDIVIIYKELNKEEGLNIPKIEINSSHISIIIKLLKYLGYGLGAFIILGLFSAIFYPDTETPIGNEIVKTTKNEVMEIVEIKVELTEIQKKDIYYIYWQAEHITGGLTIQKFGDGGKQVERDEFFKNTRLKYEKILSEKKGINFEIYSKNAIELGYGEGSDNNWKKPNSDSNDVIKYIYSEEKYSKYLKEKEEDIKKIQLENALKNLKTSDNIWMQCQGNIIGEGFLSRFKYAKIKQLSNNQVYVYATFNGKNSFGQKVKQSVICKYKYNEKYGKYEIFDVEL